MRWCRNGERDFIWAGLFHLFESIIVRKVFCLAVLSVVSTAGAVDFEKIALVDSFDFATFCDPETSTGNTAIIDHVLGTGATAVYWRNQSADVSLEAKPEGALQLDLGDVRDFARVFVNGREAAALWAKPYRCDIAPFAQKGENEIKVEVTSTWFNRLAYDFNQPPEKRKTWTIWQID